MPLTLEQAEAKIQARISVRRATWDCNAHGGMAFREPSEAEIRFEAQRLRLQSLDPHTILKAKLIALAIAGDAEAEMALNACDRGDLGCWDRAQALVNEAHRRAA